MPSVAVRSVCAYLRRLTENTGSVERSRAGRPVTGVPTPPSPPVPIAPGAWKHTEHPTPSALTRRSQASRAHREGQRGTGRELTPRHHQRVVRSLSRSRSSRGDRRPRHPAGGRGEFKGTAKVGASGVAACFSPAWRFVSLSSLLTLSCLDPVGGILKQPPPSLPPALQGTLSVRTLGTQIGH